MNLMKLITILFLYLTISAFLIVPMVDAPAPSKSKLRLYEYRSFLVISPSDTFRLELIVPVDSIPKGIIRGMIPLTKPPKPVTPKPKERRV